MRPEREYLLEKIRDARWPDDLHPELAYRGPADFVLQHGVFHEPVPWSIAWRVGAFGQCFGNSIVLGEMLGLRYVEGYAIDPGNLRAVIHHGWNLDARGNLRDSTWKNTGIAYFGVEFSVGRADDATWNGDASVLDDFNRGWPLLAEPWTGEDFARAWEPTPPILRVREEMARRRSSA